MDINLWDGEVRGLSELLSLTPRSGAPILLQPPAVEAPDKLQPPRSRSWGDLSVIFMYRKEVDKAALLGSNSFIFHFKY